MGLSKHMLRKGDQVRLAGAISYDIAPTDDALVFVTLADDRFIHAHIDDLEVTRHVFEQGDRVRVCGSTHGRVLAVLMVDEKAGQFVARDSKTGYLSIQQIASFVWERVPPVDEIAEQIASGEASEETPPAPQIVF